MTTTIDLNALNYTRDCYIESRAKADIRVFEAYLPTINFSNFYPLMYGIIAELNDNIDSSRKRTLRKLNYHPFFFLVGHLTPP